jgi:hypothetical protein
MTFDFTRLAPSVTGKANHPLALFVRQEGVGGSGCVLLSSSSVAAGFGTLLDYSLQISESRFGRCANLQSAIYNPQS